MKSPDSQLLKMGKIWDTKAEVVKWHMLFDGHRSLLLPGTDVESQLPHIMVLELLYLTPGLIHCSVL